MVSMFDNKATVHYKDLVLELFNPDLAVVCIFKDIKGSDAA